MKYLFTLVLFLYAFSNSYGQSFFGNLGKSISKGATRRFQSNTTNDVVRGVDELSIRKVMAQKRKKEAEKKRAERAKLAEQKREKAKLERERAAQERAQLAEQRREKAKLERERVAQERRDKSNRQDNYSRKPSSQSNPIEFSKSDLGKIDTYAKRLGINRNVAIRLLTIDALRKE